MRQLGPVAIGVTVLGVLLAVVLTVPTSWFTSMFGSHEEHLSAYTSMDPAPPVRVAVSSLDLAVPLIATNADPRATMDDPPIDAPLVMWSDTSAKPGASTGQTILIAHTSAHQGALSPIKDVQRGQHVQVLTKSGTMVYEVDRVRTLSPEKFDRADITLFKQSGGAGRLVMISRQDWDGSAYQSSVVLTAYPLGTPSGA
jgi:hypothetical protein